MCFHFSLAAIKLNDLKFLLDDCEYLRGTVYMIFLEMDTGPSKGSSSSLFSPDNECSGKSWS